MVCAGELEHPQSVFQQSDRCILQAHSSFSKATSIKLSALHAGIVALSAASWCAGPLPPSWSALGNLSILYLYSNNLTGASSENTRHAQKQRLLYLSALHAGIVALSAASWCAGPLPPSWSALGSLTWLVLYSNHLTGACSEPASGLCLLTSLTALVSTSMRHG